MIDAFGINKHSLNGVSVILNPALLRYVRIMKEFPEPTGWRRCIRRYLLWRWKRNPDNWKRVERHYVCRMGGTLYMSKPTLEALKESVSDG